MKTTTTRWRVPAWAWVPVAIAIVAEATSNALRAYGLGSHLEAFTISYAGYTVSLSGAVLVLAAIGVSLTQTRAAWVALTPGHTRQRIVSGVAALLLLAVSITAMASHIMEAQRAKAGGETHDRTAYAVALAAHKAAKADLERIGDVRTPAEISAAMDAARVPQWAWRETSKCIRVDDANQKQACKPILDLRQEMGRSLAKDEAEDKAMKAAADMAALKPPAEATVEAAIVDRWWAWIMGLAVVFVATFGTVIFARVETEPVATANDNAPAMPLSAPQTAHERHLEVAHALQARLGRRPEHHEIVAAGVPKGGASVRVMEAMAA